jgi:hypothetical protein
MEGTAETTNYMIAGYVFVFVVLGGYLTTFIIRWRNLLRDKEMLDDLSSTEKK